MKKVFLVILAFFFFFSCKTASHNTNSSSNLNIENSGKDITSFSINGSVGIISGTDISVTVPYGTVKTNLTPTITVSNGAKVSPESGMAQDFTTPLTYTVTAADNSTKLYTITVALHIYVLRDAGPAGGLIFYDKGSSSDGWRYLEAAPVDQVSQAWSNITNVLIGSTGTAIGTGKTNTAAIIAQAGHTTSAAKLCDDLALGGYSDWFLPSTVELYKMYENLQYGRYDENGVTYTPVIGFTSWWYWSSSEDGGNDAWVQSFDFGGREGSGKGNVLPFRCVRAF